MTTTIRVTVTQDAIDCGNPADNFACPIALALMQKFPGRHINVGASIAEIDWVGYDISQRGQKFIDDFDKGKPVHPATFQLTRLADQS